MLMTEFNLDDCIAVRLEEQMEDIVQNAFAEGLPIDVIRKITGLDVQTIKTLGSVPVVS